ncbi:sensor histidine kinase [Ruminococcus sp. 210702-SL.1.03]|uniref:sensor histidine kinase n=1 Tax=Ruminococcus sp. 210702-SL.1.03 TaxID=2883233 RepID=UPI001D08530C|nr:sensor histidine kinase [Ruminococcus sp. 210702-SL.1.03]MCB6614672.1 sensor histidine kinase [Ruminococcus sp. 210702-SL.1.03]
MKTFLAYISGYRRMVILAAAYLLIFATVLYAAEVPAETVLYAGALCLAFTAVYALVGFYRYYKRVSALKRTLSELPETLESLPTPQNESERLYTQMLQKTYAEYERAALEHRRREADMRNYYTMWVHQIKTPISALRLLIQSGARSAELQNEIFHIEQYVEMALNYQRLFCGSSDLVITRRSLDSAVRTSIRKYSKQFIMKRLKLEYEPGDITVLTDEKWLCFVIEQVLSNSLKYTSAGEIKICTVGRTLMISDTGIGIAAEDLPRIFDCSYTGYNGREEKRSSGIGLYLCSEVCRRLGHGISITSEVGKGTCVSITFNEADIFIE